MPQPNQFDLPSPAPLLTCPKCFAPMRIKVVEASESRNRIELVCDDCGTEARQDNSR